MATSSKVRFKLTTLRTKALEAIDADIERKAQEVASYGDETTLAQLTTEWRARQIKRLQALAGALEDGEVDDHALARFEVDPLPDVGAYEHRRAERDLARLQSRRTRMLAKTESLVPDVDGNIALTKTQLAEFFGL